MELDKEQFKVGQPARIVFRPEDVSLSKTDFLRPGHHKIATALVEEISFVGAYERLRLRLEEASEQNGIDSEPFYLTTDTPESQSSKSIIATRPKPEAAATKLNVGERVVVAITYFTVLALSGPQKV